MLTFEHKLCRLSSEIDTMSGDFDLQYVMCAEFTQELKSFLVTHPETIDYPFDRLKACSPLYITTSDDKKLRIYSWDTRLGGTMHFYNTVFQYRIGENVFAEELIVDEGDPSCFYNRIYTFIKEGKTFYFAINNGIYSSRDHSQEIEIFAIENGRLNKDVRLIQTKKGKIGRVDIGYNFFSLPNLPQNEKKLIYYSSEEKAIYIPIVNENMEVTGRYIIYKFNGENFVLHKIER